MTQPNAGPLKRAALYARFSSDRQNERSVEDQVALCREYCARQGYAVVAVHADSALSGEMIHGRLGLADLRRDVAAGRCDVVVVEDFDRLSRGMGDLPKLWEEFTFAGVELTAVNEGLADQIRIGVRSLTGAIYLTDLRNKSRRGCEGNIREGKRAGGLPYGYRPIPGKPGEHQVHEPEAEIVRRIFREYAEGATPRAIAAGLNQDKVPSVKGRGWNASTLNGSLKRGTGLLCNEIYRGEIVWNKVGKAKNPANGKRVPRINPPSAWKRVEVPGLRIVEDDLFQAVQERRRGTANGPRQSPSGPQRLFSGLLKCSSCGSSLVSCGTKRGKRVGMCSRARESSSCQNRQRFYLADIEQEVLEALRDGLQHPEVITAACREYHAETRRLEAGNSRARIATEKKMLETRRTIERLVDALASGHVTALSVGQRLAEAEAEVQQLEASLASMEPPKVVQLHPASLETYLGLVEKLADAVESRDDPACMKLIRELVHSIEIYPKPKGERIRFAIKGRLAALLDRPEAPHRPALTAWGGFAGAPGQRHLNPPAPEPLFLVRRVG